MDKKKNVIIGVLVAIVVLLLAALVYFVFIKKDSTVDNNKNMEDKTELSSIKEVDLDGKKITLKYYIDSSSGEYGNVFVDVYNENNELVVKEFTVDEAIAKDEFNANAYGTDYFLDQNGSKLLVLHSVSIDGGADNIIDLANKKIVLKITTGPFSDYDYEAFKEFEEEYKLNLSKYFVNNRKTVIIDKKIIGYFDYDYETKVVNYIEIKINNGNIDRNKTFITNANDVNIPMVEVEE